VISVAEITMEKEWVFEDIEVESYAGYKGEESPRAFVHLARRYEILEVLDRWYEGGLDPQDLRHDYFRVKTKDGEIFLIRYTPRFQAWTLCRKVPAPKFSNN
jgi:hypothetical protein